MHVSVIVPCRNEAQHLRGFLDSLLKQRTPDFDVEFVIADGMSDDGTREILCEYARRSALIRVIDNEGRIVSTGLNAAIRAATGDIILRMDAHTEFDATYIATCVALLQETGADNVGGPARTKAHGLMARAIAAAYHSPFSTGGAKFHDESYEGPVDTVTYGCWRRQTLERLGCFDETLVRNQDDELNLRLSRAGGKIWQSPRILSWYWPRGDLRSLFRQYFQYGFWKVAVIRKHRLPASWRHLIPVTFVISLGALVLASLVSWMVGAAVLAAWLAKLLASTVAGYLFCTACYSWQAAKSDRMDILPILPVVFGVYHCSYGLGFLAGVLRSQTNGSNRQPPSSAFTQLSR